MFSNAAPGRVNCCWSSPTQSFLVPSLFGLMTIFFCLTAVRIVRLTAEGLVLRCILLYDLRNGKIRQFLGQVNVYNLLKEWIWGEKKWARFHFCPIKRFLHKLHYLLRSLPSAACWREIKRIFMKLISYFVIITCNLHCKRSTPTSFSDTGCTVAQCLTEKASVCICIDIEKMRQHRLSRIGPFDSVYCAVCDLKCRSLTH
jgi:hypothetical protein